MTLIAEPARGPAALVRLADRIRLQSLAVVLIVTAVAVWHLSIPLTTDVSWLISVGERVLAGEVLYRDVLEANPPASVLLYLPAVSLERLTGVRAEVPVVLATVALALASLAAARAILRASGYPRVAVAVPVSEALLLVLPFDVFAQREHIAAIVLMPILSLILARGRGLSPAPWMMLVAGIGGGVAMAIKPPLALAILLPAVYVAIRLKSLRAMIRTEYVVAGLVVAAYGAVVVLVFPDFARVMMPILAETYLPAHNPYTVILLQPGVLWLAMLMIVTAFYAGPNVTRPEIAVPLLSAVGMAASFVLQGKGWAYHAYPAFAMALLAVTVAVSGRDGLGYAGIPSAVARRVTAAFAILSAIQAGLWFQDTAPPSLREAAAPWVPGHTVAVISSDIAVAHPLTRALGGRFVGTVCSQWITSHAWRLVVANPDDAALVARSRGWIAADREILRRDIAERRPQVLLVDRQGYDWLAWARRDPAIAAMLGADYHQVAAADGIEIWAHNGVLPAAAPAG